MKHFTQAITKLENHSTIVQKESEGNDGIETEKSSHANGSNSLKTDTTTKAGTTATCKKRLLLLLGTRRALFIEQDALRIGTGLAQ